MGLNLCIAYLLGRFLYLVMELPYAFLQVEDGGCELGFVAI